MYQQHPLVSLQTEDQNVGNCCHIVVNTVDASNIYSDRGQNVGNWCPNPLNTGNTSNIFLDRGYVPASGRKLHILSAYSARIRELETGLGGAGMRLNSFLTVAQASFLPPNTWTCDGRTQPLGCHARSVGITVPWGPQCRLREKIPPDK